MIYRKNCDNGAIIFDNYRYLLWRVWDRNFKQLVILMLNPSTADANKNDATITNCMKIGKKFGYGGVQIINLFAYRTSKPATLIENEYPIGHLNDKIIKIVVNKYNTILCAWGAYKPNVRNRVRQILSFIINKNLFCLAINNDGSPRHPSPRAIKQIPEKLTDYKVQLLDSLR